MSATTRVCAHRFARVRHWPIRLRYRCQKCTLLTRRYDSTDRAGCRPVHVHMSVAMPGFNTVGGAR